MNNQMQKYFTYIPLSIKSAATIYSVCEDHPNVHFFRNPYGIMTLSPNSSVTPILGTSELETKSLLASKGHLLFKYTSETTYINFDDVIHNTPLEKNTKIDPDSLLTAVKSNDQIQVNALVPMYNQSELVIRCIDSLQKCKSLAQIIVVDDCSHDGEFDIVSRFIKQNNNPKILIKKNPTNLGFTKSVNKSLKNMEGDMCFVVNSDTIPCSETLEDLIRIKKEMPALAVLGTLSNEAGPQSIPHALTTNDKVRNSVCTPQNADLFEAAVKFTATNLPEITVVPIVHGFFYLLDLKIFKELRGFDEEHFVIYGEENDYNLRVWKSNYISAVSLRNYVFHEKGASFSTHSNNESRSRKISNGNLRKLHGDLVPFAIQLLSKNDHFEAVREIIKSKITLRDFINE